jgi:hypothetical protein
MIESRDDTVDFRIEHLRQVDAPFQPRVNIWRDRAPSRKGLIQQLALPTRRSHFDGCVEPRDHFLCTTCGRIVDLETPDESLGPMTEPVRKIGDVHAVQRVFLGTCPRCADQSRGSNKGNPVAARQPQAATAEPGACVGTFA